MVGLFNLYFITMNQYVLIGWNPKWEQDAQSYPWFPYNDFKFPTTVLATGEYDSDSLDIVRIPYLPDGENEYSLVWFTYEKLDNDIETNNY